MQKYSWKKQEKTEQGKPLHITEALSLIIALNKINITLDYCSLANFVWFRAPILLSHLFRSTLGHHFTLLLQNDC